MSGVDVLTDSSGRDDEADTPEAHDREGNRFSRRMQRYASIGSTAGGVAARRLGGAVGTSL